MGAGGRAALKQCWACSGMFEYRHMGPWGAWASWAEWVKEAAKEYQHLQARKKTRDSNGVRRHSLQSRRETVRARGPEAARSDLG